MVKRTRCHHPIEKQTLTLDGFVCHACQEHLKWENTDAIMAIWSNMRDNFQLQQDKIQALEALVTAELEVVKCHECGTWVKSAFLARETLFICEVCAPAWIEEQYEREEEDIDEILSEHSVWFAANGTYTNLLPALPVGHEPWRTALPLYLAERNNWYRSRALSFIEYPPDLSELIGYNRDSNRFEPAVPVRFIPVVDHKEG